MINNYTSRVYASICPCDVNFVNMGIGMVGILPSYFFIMASSVKHFRIWAYNFSQQKYEFSLYVDMGYDYVIGEWNRYKTTNSAIKCENLIIINKILFQ